MDVNIQELDMGMELEMKVRLAEVELEDIEVEVETEVEEVKRKTIFISRIHQCATMVEHEKEGARRCHERHSQGTSDEVKVISIGKYPAQQRSCKSPRDGVTEPSRQRRLARQQIAKTRGV